MWGQAGEKWVAWGEQAAEATWVGSSALPQEGAVVPGVALSFSRVSVRPGSGCASVAPAPTEGGSQTLRPWASAPLLLLGVAAPHILSHVPSHRKWRSAQMGQHGKF